MYRVIALHAAAIEWERLGQTVEQTGSPVWLELDEALHGVRIPIRDAERICRNYLRGLSATFPRHDEHPASNDRVL